MTQDNVYLGKDDRPPGLEQVASGKVRDIYKVDEEHLLFVTTDRVSAFDVVMAEGIPHKGAVLTAIAAYWFDRTQDLIPNHMVSTNIDEIEGLDAEWREKLSGRSMLVKKAQPCSIEWVIRGYIAGSGWKEYQKQGTVCSIPLPEGLQLADRLEQPILTPTTKFEAHDRPLTPAEAASDEFVGADVYEKGEAICMELFQRGTDELARIGIRLADTKFEMGTVDGELILIDEALTPDSSRFWDNDEYQVGISPPSYDKQILRDYLETLDWNKEYPPPALDHGVMEQVAARYLDICKKITGATPMEVAQ